MCQQSLDPLCTQHDCLTKTNQDQLCCKKSNDLVHVVLDEIILLGKEKNKIESSYNMILRFAFLFLQCSKNMK